MEKGRESIGEREREREREDKQVKSRSSSADNAICDRCTSASLSAVCAIVGSSSDFRAPARGSARAAAAAAAVVAAAVVVVVAGVVGEGMEVEVERSGVGGWVGEDILNGFWMGGGNWVSEKLMFSVGTVLYVYGGAQSTGEGGKVKL